MTPKKHTGDAVETAVRMRADRLLVERGLFESRARAQAAIEAGLVVAGGRKVTKASELFPADVAIEASPVHPYVSRGALKLAAALDHYSIEVHGRTALDVGSSTGGFTELLLERGARNVFAVDTGTGQLHARLRGDPRIVSLERTDIRTLGEHAIGEAVDLVTIDVSFISLKLVLPAALRFAAPAAGLVALIKPQFEAGREHLRNGIVRDAATHERVCREIGAAVGALGWRHEGTIPSPVTGGDGNREFLLHARRF
jgi:23S rRNA (cytidine1920-2'-O)/16S rRNA (cytidine1409-2'-O)-methyltransferase